MFYWGGGVNTIFDMHCYSTFDPLSVPTNRRKRSAFMTYSNNVPLSKKTTSYGSSSTFTLTFNSVSLVKRSYKNLSKSVKQL